MTTPTTSPDKPTRDLDALVYPGFALLCIGVAVWLVLSWGRYRDRVPQAERDWAIGATHLVEITLTRDDRAEHACASAAEIDGMACPYGMDHRQLDPPLDDEQKILRPYTTVRGEHFLGAGLWSAPDLARKLPASPFSVVCNLHVQGVVRSVALRWELKGHFKPVKTSLPAGALTDCAFPK